MPLPPIHHAFRQGLAPPALTDGEGLHVFLQVQVQKLAHEIQLVPVGVDDVEKAHDVGVVHFLEEGDFANGGGGDAFVFGFEADLLERDDALVGGVEVAGLVDDAVGACAGGMSVRWLCHWDGRVGMARMFITHPRRPSRASGNSPSGRCC